MNKAVPIAVLVLLLTSFSITSVVPHFSVKARLPVLNVNTGLDYATIQEAIDAEATLAGHTIRVDPGVYYENVTVNKSVTLSGANNLDTVIDGRASGSVIHVTANHVTIMGFTIRNSSQGYSGIYLDHSNGDNISENVLENNYHGIYVYGSNDNIAAHNEATGNEYGIRLYNSSNNDILRNNASNNANGIHLDLSSNNTLVGNDAWSNSGNGIFLYGSGNNTVSENSANSNYGRGIRLQYSFDNTLSNNVVSSNTYGISLYGSERNILMGNNVSYSSEPGILFQDSSDGNTISYNSVTNNFDGIWFIDSDSNTVSGNNVSSNNEYGIRLWNSSRGTFFDNNFLNNSAKNIEQPSNTSILNLWDDGFEGNFWDDYQNATDVNGIGDRPYIVDFHSLGVYSQDSYPLMGQFFPFSTNFENRSYIASVISNFTITEFNYDRGSDDTINAMRFSMSAPDNESAGFCLVCIPHVLVTPPYVVTIDQTAPISYTVIRTNGTHTWIYLTYTNSNHELEIQPVVPQEASIWSSWWFWGIFGLALIGIALAFLTFAYRRKIAEQARLLQTYSPFVIAEALFNADIERRGMKIKDFEKKYGVKIQPRANLEDVIKSLVTKEKEEK